MTNNYSGLLYRGPDVILEELTSALSKDTEYEFKHLLALIQSNLRSRDFHGGEELLHLKIYEKLQGLVGRGKVEKIIANGVKKYRGRTVAPASQPRKK